jgi:hypothetical protein
MRYVLHESDELFCGLHLGPLCFERDLATVEHDKAVGDVEDMVDVATQ